MTFSFPNNPGRGGDILHPLARALHFSCLLTLTYFLTNSRSGQRDIKGTVSFNAASFDKEPKESTETQRTQDPRSRRKWHIHRFLRPWQSAVSDLTVCRELRCRRILTPYSRVPGSKRMSVTQSSTQSAYTHLAQSSQPPIMDTTCLTKVNYHLIKIPEFDIQWANAPGLL